jgi:hypothetical protein
MSRLYPRLLPWHAKNLYEEYRGLKPSELTAHSDTTHTSAVFVATGGDRVSATDLAALRNKVVTLATDAGFPDESNRSSSAEFDLRLAALLHAEMGLVPAEAASGDVWAFLALVLLPDVAYWRYGPLPNADRVQATDITRHVFGRMWWRAARSRSWRTEPLLGIGDLGRSGVRPDLRPSQGSGRKPAPRQGHSPRVA